jgi:hypothetical protein
MPQARTLRHMQPQLAACRVLLLLLAAPTLAIGQAVTNAEQVAAKPQAAHIQMPDYTMYKRRCAWRMVNREQLAGLVHAAEPRLRVRKLATARHAADHGSTPDPRTELLQEVVGMAAKRPDIMSVQTEAARDGNYTVDMLVGMGAGEEGDVDTRTGARRESSDCSPSRARDGLGSQQGAQGEGRLAFVHMQRLNAPPAASRGRCRLDLGPDQAACPSSLACRWSTWSPAGSAHLILTKSGCCW